MHDKMKTAAQQEMERAKRTLLRSGSQIQYKIAKIITRIESNASLNSLGEFQNYMNEYEAAVGAYQAARNILSAVEDDPC